VDEGFAKVEVEVASRTSKYSSQIFTARDWPVRKPVTLVLEVPGGELCGGKLQFPPRGQEKIYIVTSEQAMRYLIRVLYS